MADAEWIGNIRKIVLQAIEAGNPCDVVFGTVAKSAPLEIQIGPKTFLQPYQLILPQGLTDHTDEMSIPEIGTVNSTVKNALKAGEQVLLIQKWGGQQYLVVDRWQEGG